MWHSRNTLVPILIAGAAVAGCVTSSGILPAGPNTYTLKEHVAPIAGGGMQAQRVALEKANAFCKSQGREMMPLDLKGSDPRGIYGETSYSATFRCLLPTDPEFRR
jgi:hypothetical protein